MSRKPVLLIGIVAVVAVVSTACGSSNATSEPSGGLTFTAPSLATTVPGTEAPTAAAPPDIVDSAYEPSPPAADAAGGLLTIGGWEWPDAVLPYFARYSYDTQLSSAMFDGLVKVTPGLRYVPDLATSVPTLENGGVKLTSSGMDVDWNLRLGMKWSDGQPIDCNDIAGTWQWVTDPANKFLAVGLAGWQDVTGVDGGDGTSCVMHFDKVYEGYLSLVDPLLPAHYLTTVPVAQAGAKLYSMNDLASGVYSGPYVPITVTAHSEIDLKPNPNYATVSGHAPYLDGLDWKYFGDAKSMAAAFAAGSIGFAQDMTESDLSSLADVPVSDVVAKDSQTYELLAFNTAAFTTKYGADAAMVVRALRLAIDRRAIVAGPLGSSVSVIDNFVSPLSWYYADISGGGVTDVDSAKALLANMGWSAGSDGYLAKDGQTLTLDLCTTTRQVRVDTLTLVAGQLKQVGVKANVHPVAASTMFGTWAGTPADTLCNLTHGNFDVAEFSYVSTVDPLPGYTTYVSSETPDDSPGHTGQNLTRVHNDTLDQAYETIDTTVDLAQIRQAMAAVQNVYVSDQNTFELPLYFHKDVWLVSPELHNFVGGPTGYGGTWNVGDWWLG